MAFKPSLIRVSILLVTLAAFVPFNAFARPEASLGIYGGAGCDGARAMETFAQWFGQRPDRVLDFMSWESLLANASWSMRCWANAGVKEITYSVPMLPEDGSATLAQGAAGEFDALFRAFAETLLNTGYPHAVIRIGWEFNGEWYPWAASKDPASWIAYWRRIVTAMRSVPEARFQFDWCPGNGWTSFLAEDAYPGDEYVDIIGLDEYNASWNPNTVTPEQRWNEQLNQRHGLRWHAKFAASRGKPMSFPEWATGERRDGKGAGDDPYFIEQMAEWIATHDVAYHSYWDYNAPIFRSKLSDGSHPHAAAAFLRKFKLPRPKPPVFERVD